MKRTLLLTLAAVTLGLGVLVAARSDGTAQEEDPDRLQVLMVSANLCLAFASDFQGAPPTSCFDTWNPGSLHTVADRVSDNAPEEDRDCPASAQGDSQNPAGDFCILLLSDFVGMDLDGNQLHQEDPPKSGFGGQPSMYVIAFVPDDDPIEFRANKGEFVEVALGPGPFPLTGSVWLCDNEFEDCDGDNQQLKGAVLVPFGANGADLGPGRITVSQGTQNASIDFTVVGEPEDILIEAFGGKDTIINGITDVEDEFGNPNPNNSLGEDPECPLPTDVPGFAAALARPDKTVLIARVSDAAGQNITQAWVHWGGTGVDYTAADPGIGEPAHLGLGATPTLDLGGFGFGAPQVLCGTQGTGDLEVTARIEKVAQQANPLLVDPNAGVDQFRLPITVIEPPSVMTLAADPPSLDCNGTNTSTIKATLTNADGDLVPNGQNTRFSVQVLGTVNPLVANTTDGIASSVLTPLRGDASVGVPVIVTMEPENSSYDPITSSILVRCTGAVAPAQTTPGAGPQPGAGTPAGTIRPPDTGSGGDLDGRGAQSGWAVAGLFIGAMALVGARYGLRGRV